MAPQAVADEEGDHRGGAGVVGLGLAEVGGDDHHRHQHEAGDQQRRSGEVVTRQAGQRTEPQ